MLQLRLLREYDNSIFLSLSSNVAIQIVGSYVFVECGRPEAGLDEGAVPRRDPEVPENLRKEGIVAVAEGTAEHNYALAFVNIFEEHPGANKH